MSQVLFFIKIDTWLSSHCGQGWAPSSPSPFATRSTSYLVNCGWYGMMPRIFPGKVMKHQFYAACLREIKWTPTFITMQLAWIALGKLGASNKPPLLLQICLSIWGRSPAWMAFYSNCWFESDSWYLNLVENTKYLDTQSKRKAKE